MLIAWAQSYCVEAFTIIPLAMIALSSYVLWFIALNRTLSGPRVWPLVGSLPGLVRNSARMHDWIADNLRKTSLATYQTCICAVPFLARRQGLITVTGNPKNMEHILKLRFDNYPKGPTWQAAFHDLLGEGIFNSDGETWLVQRKTAALEFTTRTLRQAMGRWVNRSIKNRLWRVLESAECGKKAVDFQDLLLRLTFDNICGLAFGKDPETLSPEMVENPFCSAFDRATEATLERFIFPEFVWKVKKMLGLGTEVTLKQSVKIVEKYLTDIIETRKRSMAENHHNNAESAVQYDDLLSRFMKKKDGHGKGYSSDVLRHIVLNFVLAGRDTSSVALSWFFYLVMNNPRVEEKIVAEISGVLSETRGPIPAKWTEEPLTFDEVDRLVYLKAALSETLRLYPSVPQDFKYVLNDDVLPDGTMVPAGSSVTYSIYSVGRMEWVWGKDCLEFRPERWLSKEGDKYEPPQDPFKFVSFNGGPRICLGKELAYLQMKSIAAAVLLRHRLSLVPSHPVVQKMSLTLFMQHGLKVYVSPRKLTAY